MEWCLGLSLTSSSHIRPQPIQGAKLCSLYIGIWDQNIERNKLDCPSLLFDAVSQVVPFGGIAPSSKYARTASNVHSPARSKLSWPATSSIKAELLRY